MHNYDLADFLQYYTGAHILHPRNDTVVKVVGQDRNNPGYVLFSDKTSATLQEIDWKHVQTPPLGYRHLMDGKFLGYVQRRAGRRAEKGVTPSAITIEVVGVVAQLANAIGVGADVMKHAVLDDKLASNIFHPEFKTVEEAVNLLTTKKHALGYAISNDWAVTLGLFASAPFLLHFKNARVAGSKDGKAWKWDDEDAQFVYERGCLK